MTGANYTGGKRNVARTRFRDSTRRVQKNHFGRRRLGILSRGLVNGAHTRAEEPAPGISGIQLEHAQRDISRLPRSSPARQTGAVGAFASDGTPSAVVSSSNKSSNDIPSNLRTLGDGSYSSLRAEMDRVLEFSRTVGLCNYATSPKQGAPASLTSHLDSEPERSSSRQQRHDNLHMSESSGSRRTKTCIGHATQLHENLQTPQTRTQLHSLRETASPTSDCGYLEYYVSQSPARSRSTVEPQLSQETGSPGFLERDPYPRDPFPPSFDALEFSTSPLPPSSPLPSSTTYGSLLSLCQLPLEAETTILDSDRIPLSSMVSGSYDAGSPSSHGGSRHLAPDLASTPPSRRLPRSCLVRNTVPTLLASSSKTDLIPDLLKCNNPWDVIGDVLDLPPIPVADATYFSSFQSLNTPRMSSQASSSSGQVDMIEPLSPAGDKDTRSRAVHSDRDLVIRPNLSQLRFSREATRRASSPLISRNPPTKRVSFPARPFHSSPEARMPSHAGPHQLSPAESASIPFPSEATQSVLVSRALSPSPRTPDGKSGLSSETTSARVKTLSPPSRVLTPQRSTFPSPKNLNLLDTSVSRSPGIASSHLDAIIGFDPTTLVSKVPTTQATAPKARRPKLECPDLFQDEEDSLTGIF